LFKSNLKVLSVRLFHGIVSFRYLGYGVR